jgi:hypothetical protein
MLAWIAAAALAYETDQLTDRDQPLEDALPYANAQMDAEIRAVVHAANAELGCDGDPVAARDVVARLLRGYADNPRLVLHRGLLRSFGFGAYSYLLETGPIDRRAFLDRSDIYGGISIWRSPILGGAGPASTILLAGVLMGTDKLDHFLVNGEDLWRASRDGADDERAKRLGTRTENNFFGLKTSLAFSWGDLRADWDGYQFYRAQFRDGGMLQLDELGCIAQRRPFDWAEWVDPGWDEVINPSVYTKGVQKAVTRRLQAEKATICAQYAVWGTDELREARAAALADRATYRGAKAPDGVDPFALDVLCGGSP